MRGAEEIVIVRREGKGLLGALHIDLGYCDVLPKKPAYSEVHC
jgi:hypothetical protein